jgi:hypothetical protein
VRRPDRGAVAGAFRETSGREWCQQRIASVRTLGPLPSYTITVQAYGGLAQATEKMTTSVLIGSQEWFINGIWKRTNSGWKLSVVDTY